MFHYKNPAILSIALGVLAATACSNGMPGSSSVPTITAAADAHGTAQVQNAVRAMAIDPHLSLASGFKAEVIGNVPGAREIVVAPNGDLLVGTQGHSIAIVANADGSGAANAPATLVTLPETPAAGLALGPNDTLYVGTEHAVWKVHYTPGDHAATNAQQIAALRTGPVAPGSDGDVHRTTSVLVEANTLYAGVGSSCNACTEADSGRAAILRMGLNGENLQVYAKNVRNAMALAVNPHTWFVWAGGAGQDNLAAGHPYEYFDSITQHPAGSSWGWPNCEEHDVAYTPGFDCGAVILPHIELPAYSTIMGATFYPPHPHGPYAFAAVYGGGLFLTAHGSWHRNAAGEPLVAPHVIFVPMKANGWDAQIPIDWSNPKAQFQLFFFGFNVAGTAQLRGRPTGIAIGPNGSLFVADDLTGNIYRVRPISRPRR